MKQKKETRGNSIGRSDRPISTFNYDTKAFRKIIQDYWQDLEDIEASWKMQEYREENSIDFRAIKLIHVLRDITTWKSNIYILSLFFKVRELARLLGVTSSAISSSLHVIKKEIIEKYKKIDLG